MLKNHWKLPECEFLDLYLRGQCCCLKSSKHLKELQIANTERTRHSSVLDRMNWRLPTADQRNFLFQEATPIHHLVVFVGAAANDFSKSLL